LLMDTWQWPPFATLVFLAGFATVPTEIEEAASLETDSWFRILRHIHLPYLLPGLTAVLILRTADIMKLFDMVFVMTRGGPGYATTTLGIILYQQGFVNWQYGRAAAIGVVIFLLSLVFTVALFSMQRREGELQ
ncbi:MAG: sugar ABC transporter permease, partial [Clostridia bacterium]